MDRDAYLARIGWDGPLHPNLATLSGLLLAHTGSIHFENFDCLLGRPIRLDLESIQAKLIGARRGGYCFEHATLFAAVLRSIGFDPVAHTARVIAFSPRSEAPRTHMFLTVAVGGVRYLVDPGFGFYGSPQPVPVGGETATHRLVRDDDVWVLYATRDDALFPAWVTTLEADNHVDFEMGSYFTSTHPGSPFTQTILASARTADGRVNIMGNRVSRVGGGERMAVELDDRAALRAVVRESFGFDLPELERMVVPAVPGWG